jgi:hypothetical protein
MIFRKKLEDYSFEELLKRIETLVKESVEEEKILDSKRKIIDPNSYMRVLKLLIIKIAQQKAMVATMQHTLPRLHEILKIDNQELLKSDYDVFKVTEKSKETINKIDEFIYELPDKYKEISQEALDIYQKELGGYLDQIENKMRESNGQQ